MFLPNKLIQEKLKQIEEGRLGAVAAMNDVFKLLDQDGLMYVMKVDGYTTNGYGLLCHAHSSGETQIDGCPSNCASSFACAWYNKP